MLKTFQGKLTASLIGLVAGSLVLSFIAVSLTTRANVEATARQELQTGARVLEQLMQTRSAQLRNSVEVLAEDFGFREAVATADTPTIQSALLNHARRVGADTGFILDMDGNIRASIDRKLSAGRQFPETEFLAAARDGGGAASLLGLGGSTYQAVIVPVRAPLQIGWVVLGFAVDAKLLQDLSALTGAQVGIVGSDGLAGTTLSGNRAVALQRRLDAGLLPDTAIRLLELDGENFLTLAVPLGSLGDRPVYAILQQSLSEALSDYRQLQYQLLAIAGFALFVALLVAVFIASGVTQPVRELVQRAQQIARGDYSLKLHLRRRDEIGQLASAFNTMQEGIAEREERIVFQAHHDSLTNLPNRVLAQDRLRQAIQRAERTGQPAALLMLDLDRFKEINDTLGHQLGDEVLQAVADRLQDAVRGVDTVSRLGGDEFMLILEDVQPEVALAKAEDIADALARPMLIGESTLHVQVSVGVVLVPDHGRDPEQLLRRADIAMYDAKQTHEKALLYRAGRDESHLMRLRLIGDLRVAAANQQFRLFYQPKLDLKSGEITEVEALIRWQHPEHGFMPPDEFIALAEQSGNISLVTEWVLKTGLAQLRGWLDRGMDLRLSVNISAIDLIDPVLPERISSHLKKFDIEPSRLTLEITESAVMRDAEFAIAMLARLTEAGVRISIDDFGTGYSSLAQLKRLPVNELKIDKSFVMELDADSEDAIIVRSTIELAHNMGLQVIAEGVENIATQELLSGYACDYAQGFLISKPMEGADFTTWSKSGVYPIACAFEEGNGGEA